MTRATVVLMLALAGAAMAQGPAATPAPGSAARPAEPTLDELLGLGKPAGESKPGDAAPDRSQADLTRKLDTQDPGDEFAQTVALMGDAARRLAQARDAGLETQRVQEEILKRLDKLIAEAGEQKKGGKSKQQQQQDKDQQQSQPASQQRAQQRQQSKAQPGGEPGAPQAPREDGALRQRAGSAATWGNLPARVRDALTEGLNDAFSARYRQKTEEYYRRLAEQRRPEGGR